MNKLLKYIAIIALVFLANSCTSKFDDINTDPDAYTTAPYTNILCYSIEQTGLYWGDDLSYEPDWVGYISKIQYTDNYNYIPTDNIFGNKWACTYRVYRQLNEILDRTASDTVSTKNLRNVCKVWQSFVMMMNVDCFGDCPYSMACKGAEGILQTPYDNQKSIYAALDSVLTGVANSWANGKGSDNLGKGDVMFGGDITKWRKFCNSLRLRMAMRLVNVEAQKSQSIVESILNNPSTYPVINTSSDNAYFWWDGTSTYYDRYYSNAYKDGRDDHGMGAVFIDYLNEQHDPRIATFAKVAESDSTYRGCYNGYNSVDSINIYSRIGAKYRDNPTGFTPYYRACETYFIEAEAALKGWNVPLTPDSAYNEGVRCSMADNDISEKETQKYLSGKGKYDGTLGRVYYEMWTGLFKEMTEAWCLYRRTGYPQEIHTSMVYYKDHKTILTKQFPGEFSHYGTAHNDVPFRFPYPNNQELYNPTNLGKVKTGIKDYCWGKKLYWDTRSDQEYY